MLKEGGRFLRRKLVFFDGLREKRKKKKKKKLTEKVGKQVFGDRLEKENKKRKRVGLRQNRLGKNVVFDGRGEL